MTLRHRCLTLAAALGAVSLIQLGCSSHDGAGAAPRTRTPIEQAPAPRSAVPAGAVDAPGADEVRARLRAEGPAALARLLRAYDAATGAERDRLAGWVDRVAAQRYATVSRLFWYTDLDEAGAAARAAGKPILSLRMLGQLDEDRSCANSRFFRVALYANAALSSWLGEHFILHWSSERPVPRLTIDYGDGRRIETTIAGNSAHYVLDADGRVLDVVPGLVTPRAFRAELEGALALAAQLDFRTRSARGLTAAERAAFIERYHTAAQATINDQWAQLGAAGQGVPVATWGTSVASAQAVTVTKARVEVPVVKTARLGGAPADLAADSPAWEQVGVRLLALRGLEQDAGEGAGLERIVELDARVLPPPVVLDEQSRALLATLAPADWGLPGQALDPGALDQVITTFEASIVGDTALNLLRLRAEIHGHLAGLVRARAPLAFDDVNTWVYAFLFGTPARDAWLGMATPGVFTGLPGDGVVVTAN